MLQHQLSCSFTDTRFHIQGKSWWKCVELGWGTLSSMPGHCTSMPKSCELICFWPSSVIFIKVNPSPRWKKGKSYWISSDLSKTIMRPFGYLFEMTLDC